MCVVVLCWLISFLAHELMAYRYVYLCIYLCIRSQLENASSRICLDGFS